MGHGFRRLGLLVAIYVPPLLGSFVMGIRDPGGDQALTIFERFLCIDKFADKVTVAKLKGSPNSPYVFAGMFMVLASDKRSYSDVLVLEIRQAKMPPYFCWLCSDAHNTLFCTLNYACI